MTNIKEVIQIALNEGFLKPRYTVNKVEIGTTIITVYYYDNLFSDDRTCQFSV